jgi:outer membrane biosynthesis protein TonB
MRLDRAEWTGTGAAVLFHVALISALSLSLAHVASIPEPPAMDVEFVDEVGLTAAAPQQVATPPPASQAPEIGQAEPVEPVPVIEPKPQPSIVPTPAKPRLTPAKPPPRVSKLGDDFLKGIENDKLAPRTGPARPAAPTFSATARIGIGQSIIRQVQPCADRQPYIGEGANRVKLKINLKLARNGRLLRPPTVLGMAGDPDLRAKYGELLEDQVRRIFADCSPLRLPAELYDTPDGGWNDYTFIYRVS